MERFVFWNPELDQCIEAGPERRRIPLPPIPLPLLNADGSNLPPTDDAIGRGIYDYLRQFPDCAHASCYASLLRDGYPHYLADLAAQLVMLEEKEVDGAYIQRKISGLKIFMLLEPENAALLMQLGKANYDLALQFTELVSARSHMLNAMGFLQKIECGQPQIVPALNLLASIDLWFGDIPSAQRRLILLLDQDITDEGRRQLHDRLDELANHESPPFPPIDELETLGQALILLGSGQHQVAEAVLEGIEHRAILPKELLGAEFYFLLGHSREAQGDVAGAMRAYVCSLSQNGGYPPSLAGMERLAAAGDCRDR